MIRPEDRAHLERAIALAARGGRLTAPNPRVGALVVAGGEVVGEGWHHRAGGPHAEVFALEAAGERARGATLYSSLEPCAHFGRTPPCTTRIVEAGVARVVVGIVDPDPRVRGEGLATLTSAGLEVDVADNALQRAAEEEIEEYLLHRREGRAFALLKMASTLDGRIADREGSSRWITGQAARAHGRRLRERYGAIVVGAGTVRADDPLLLPPTGVGGEGDPPFFRVVVDGALDTPPGSRLLAERHEGAPVLIFGAKSASAARARALEAGGAELVLLDAPAEALPPLEMLRELGRRGVLGAVVEGGGFTHGVFLAAGAVDKLHWYIAPSVLGDREGTAVVDAGARRLAELFRLRIASTRALDDDLLLTLYPR